MDNQLITSKVVDILLEVFKEDGQNANGIIVDKTSPIVGSKAIISSRGLVEVMLLVEEYAEDELGVEFDWQHDATLSARRSIFKTPQSLAAHLVFLQKEIP